MFCEKCGNRLNDGARFCNKCGSQINADGGTNSPAQNPPPAQYSAPVYASPAGVAVKKKSPVKKIIIIIAAVLVAILAGLHINNVIQVNRMNAEYDRLEAEEAERRRVHAVASARLSGIWYQTINGQIYDKSYCHVYFEDRLLELSLTSGSMEFPYYATETHIMIYGGVLEWPYRISGNTLYLNVDGSAYTYIRG